MLLLVSTEQLNIPLMVILNFLLVMVLNLVVVLQTQDQVQQLTLLFSMIMKRENLYQNS